MTYGCTNALAGDLYLCLEMQQSVYFGAYVAVQEIAKLRYSFVQQVQRTIWRRVGGRW